MPNYCHNELRATGSEEAMEKFQKDTINESEELDFNIAVPAPADIGDGWYDWNIENWGTKWGPCYPEFPEVSTEKGVTEFSVIFDTAWAPPTDWFNALAARHPEVTVALAYSEPGMGFEGIVEKKGVSVLLRKEFKTVQSPDSLTHRLRAREA